MGLVVVVGMLQLVEVSWAGGLNGLAAGCGDGGCLGGRGVLGVL